MLGCLSNQVNELSGQTTIGWLTRQPGEERFSFFARERLSHWWLSQSFPIELRARTGRLCGIVSSKDKLKQLQGAGPESSYRTRQVKPPGPNEFFIEHGANFFG